MKKYLFSLILLSSLTACGQFGPLYLPDDPHPPVHVAKPVPEKNDSKPNTESEKN